MARQKNRELKSDDKEQFNRFVATARALDCDEDKDRFEKALGKIAAYKPLKDHGQSKKRTRAKSVKNAR